MLKVAGLKERVESVGQVSTIPAEALMSISSTVQPSRWTMEACPLIPAPPPPNPPSRPGATTAWVIPLARATGRCSLEGWIAVAARRWGFISPSSTVSTVALMAPISVRPSWLTESIIPG